MLSDLYHMLISVIIFREIFILLKLRQLLFVLIYEQKPLVELREKTNFWLEQKLIPTCSVIVSVTYDLLQ